MVQESARIRKEKIPSFLQINIIPKFDNWKCYIAFK